LPVDAEEGAIPEFTIETCQDEGASSFIYRPDVGAPVRWEFRCIEGAKSLATSAVFILGAAIMME
jgi:hypothetical protein